MLSLAFGTQSFNSPSKQATSPHVKPKTVDGLRVQVVGSCVLQEPSKHAAFQIKVTRSRSWTVQHRFSHFEMLLSLLKRRFPHVSFPTLPKTRLLRSFDQSYLEDKSKRLNAFLEELLSRCPDALRCPEFQAFLRGEELLKKREEKKREEKAPEPVAESPRSAAPIPPASQKPNKSLLNGMGFSETRFAQSFPATYRHRQRICTGDPSSHVFVELSKTCGVQFTAYKTKEDLLHALRVGTVLVRFPALGAEIVVAVPETHVPRSISAPFRLVGTGWFNGVPSRFSGKCDAAALSGSGSLLPLEDLR